MLTRLAVVLSCASVLALAQTPVTVEVRTEAAQCSAIARGSACLQYTQAPLPDTAGVLAPGFAIVRVMGPEGAAAVMQAVVLSPAGRQWLRVRRAGTPVGGTSVTDQLPQLDLELYVDETQAREMRPGRFLANLVVTVSGVSTPVKLPVQLAVGPDTIGAIKADPDAVPDLTVNATANPQPLRFGIGVRRSIVGPPLQVSVTPDTSDGNTWLTTDLQAGLAPCSTSAVPCEFDAIVTPPQQAGDYWGAWVIAGSDGYADRVAVRVKVNPAPGQTPPVIEPRQISLAAPLGATAPVSAVVNLKSGYDGIAFRAERTQPWLTVEPAAARWPAALKLTADPSGLEAGPYTDTLSIRAVDTGELLATIPVTLAITSPVFAPAMLDGGGWQTSLYLVNPGKEEAKVTLRFWAAGAASGVETPTPWLVGLAGRGLVNQLENLIIPPLGMMVVDTQGAQSNRQQGWAALIGNGPVSMHAALAETKTGARRPVAVDATIPLMNPFRDRLLLPFDQLAVTGGAAASIALANPDDQAVTIEAVVLNESGAEVAKEGKFTLPARGAGTFALSTKWPSSAQRRGVLALNFDGGRLFATGLRALGSGSFHAYPAVARGELGVDRGIPGVTAGGAWQSTAYLTNSSTLGQSGALRLWPAGVVTGLSSESAMPVPANGVLMWQAPVADGVLAESSGWLESRYPKQVGGFLLLRQTLNEAGPRWESALDGNIGMNGRLAIPFDNRGANSTQIVLVNTNESPTEIQTVIYDLGGRLPRFGETFKLAGKGQLVVNSADRWEAGGQQGYLEFSSRHSFRLSGVGLRFGEGPVAILPAHAR